MNKNFGTLALVVIVAVLLGVGVVSKQAKDPLLRELLVQQTEMAQAQNKILSKLDSGESGNIAEVMKRLQSLEMRIAKLEANNAGNAQPRPNVQMPPPEDFSKVYDIPVDHTPIIGKADAPVTITEFVDFQCPFCARFHPPIDEVMQKNPGKVRILIKNFPLSFHPQARPGAKAAMAAAQQGKFEQMANELLKNGNALSEDKFKEIAGQIGLNVDQFMKDYKDKDSLWEDYIQKDMALGTDVGVRGTPTIYINGRKTNARDLPSLQAEIDKILAEK